MSFEFGIIRQDDQLPGYQAINSKLSALGFEIIVHEFEWGEHSGYLPCSALGRATGFELSADHELLKRGFLKKPEQQVRVVFRIGGSLEELMVAQAVVYALLELGAGTPWSDYEDEASPDYISGEAARAYCKHRFLIARIDAGADGLPPTEPPLAPYLETESMRALMIEEFGRDEIREAKVEGNLRLHKNVLARLQPNEGWRTE